MVAWLAEQFYKFCGTGFKPHQWRVFFFFVPSQQKRPKSPLVTILPIKEYLSIIYVLFIVLFLNEAFTDVLKQEVHSQKKKGLKFCGLE